MDLNTFLFLLPIVLASLTLHELAHAYVAWRLGDPTAKQTRATRRFMSGPAIATIAIPSFGRLK